MLHMENDIYTPDLSWLWWLQRGGWKRGQGHTLERHPTMVIGVDQYNIHKYISLPLCSRLRCTRTTIQGLAYIFSWVLCAHPFSSLGRQTCLVAICLCTMKIWIKEHNFVQCEKHYYYYYFAWLTFHERGKHEQQWLRGTQNLDHKSSQTGYWDREGPRAHRHPYQCGNFGL